MGVSTRIEHHAVIVGAAGMDLVNQRALVVALEKSNLAPQALRLFADVSQDGLEGFRAVHPHLPDAGEVDVRPIEYQEALHGSFSSFIS